MKFEVKNRWTQRVQFTAEIECDESAGFGFKLGLAVKWARDNDADLRDADLCGADLRDADLRDADLRDAVLRDAVLCGADLRDADLCGADLRDADLRYADLRGADLRGAVLRDAVLRDAVLRDADLCDADLRDADLRDAVLRSFKACLWMTLSEYPNEANGVANALREGRVDGSTYSGECACLVGTIGNLRGVSGHELPHNASHPSEQWFMMIKKGDKPGDDTAGGFASQKALEWVEEWLAIHRPGALNGETE